MQQNKDTVLAVDYHSENIEFRWFSRASGQMRTGRYPTTREGILRQLKEAKNELAPGGRIVWIMESTTGWARVKELLGNKAQFVLSNVLQMPLPPKARRRKSDRIDTGRILREYLSGSLPTSFQPDRGLREVRRVVDSRQDLVERQTAIKNWINSLLHHETWEPRENLWSEQGLTRLRAMKWAPSDRMLLEIRLQELGRLQESISQIEAQMQEIENHWPEAQWVDEMRGIGMVTAVSVVAHIGPIERFPTAEDLISYAGLAPGQQQSDQTRRDGHIGGGGTDGHLRYLLIEATTWLCEIPRYRETYERVLQKRGSKVARIVVARLALRSIYKMLKDRRRFDPAPAARPTSVYRFEPTGGGSEAKEKARRVPSLQAVQGRPGARVARQRCPILQAGKTL